METIKEEKKADLEQLLSKLLNDLLRMGWEPFNRDKTLHIDCYDKCKGLNYKWIHLDGGFMNEESRTLRELVSVDSGLWQFVCENHLYIYKMGESKNFIQDHFKNEYNECCYQYLWDKSCYEYYLLESALKDESELEDFLLSNIVIKDE